MRVLIALALSLSCASSHAFCGFFVSGADQKLYNNASHVVLMRSGTRTVLAMQNNYQGPPQDFAMVVPVPVVLQKENVKTLPANVFDRVDSLSAPRLVEYWEQDPCPSPNEEDGDERAGYGRGDKRPSLKSADAPAAPPRPAHRAAKTTFWWASRRSLS